MYDVEPPKGRVQLAEVLAATKDVITVAEVARALEMQQSEAAKRLSRWAEQGWVRRIGRGAYAPVALESLGLSRVVTDPWVLVPALYGPAYIGGWTAAEHWDLTEQIFKDTVVLTTRSLRARHQMRDGIPFHLKHIKADKMFGLRTVWRQKTQVPVSDVHRTIVDMLDDPALGPGIQHASDCLSAYFRRADRDDDKLIAYGDQLGNGAVFKRLGFLAERFTNAPSLLASCRQRLTPGNAKLDPALPAPRLVTTWRLRVPHTWMKA